MRDPGQPEGGACDIELETGRSRQYTTLRARDQFDHKANVCVLASLEPPVGMPLDAAAVHTHICGL